MKNRKNGRIKCRLCNFSVKKGRAWLMAQHYKLEHPGRKKATKKGGKRVSQVIENVQAEGDRITQAYAFGHVEAWLEVYARSHSLSPSALTHRVAELLRRSAGR